VIGQLVLVAALLLIGAYLLKARKTASQQAIRRLAILGALVLGALAVLFPSYTNVVASLLGIGRGADLLLYSFVIFALFYVVHQYRRQLWQEKTITDLARSLALLRAAHEDALAAQKPRR
jgi:hypothetical protein